MHKSQIDWKQVLYQENYCSHKEEMIFHANLIKGSEGIYSTWYSFLANHSITFKYDSKWNLKRYGNVELCVLHRSVSISYRQNEVTPRNRKNSLHILFQNYLKKKEENID